MSYPENLPRFVIEVCWVFMLWKRIFVTVAEVQARRCPRPHTPGRIRTPHKSMHLGSLLWVIVCGASAQLRIFVFLAVPKPKIL